MRVRQETIDVEDEPDFTGSRNKDRQRIRARLGAFTKVNSEVETGIQVASGSGADRRSTNENMDNYFDKKAVWLDLAYISYVPVGRARPEDLRRQDEAAVDVDGRRDLGR